MKWRIEVHDLARHARRKLSRHDRSRIDLADLVARKAAYDILHSMALLDRPIAWQVMRAFAQSYLPMLRGDCDGLTVIIRDCAVSLYRMG